MSSFEGTAAAYRRSFATLCAGTIPALLAATDTEGLHLDVGCGTGELARAAVAEGRQVLALDPDPDMVALSRSAGAPGPGSLTVRQAGAPGLPLADGSAGAVTANFVVNHVPDPRAAVRDLARAAAPSAPIAMTIWPSTPGPHLAAYGEAARACGAVPVPRQDLPTALDFARSADGLAGLAGLALEAGLEVVQADEIGWTWHVAADDLMAGIAAGIAGPGRLHRAQSPEARARIEEAAREGWSDYAEADGRLAFPVTAVLVVATRP